MNKRRVVITGIGPITPIGTSRDPFWSGLEQQRSAVRSLTRFDPSEFRSHNAAEINDFVPSDHLDRRSAKRLDRFAQFSVVGAQMVTQGLRAVDATLALAVFGGAASCNIAIELGVMGPNSTNAMSCASGTIAIGDAFRQIRDGYADVMIAGGAEAPLAPLCYGAFALIRAMSTRNEEPEMASRPFDKDRDGFVMGEGAAVLILEEYERAKSRGAPIYAEVAGYGITNDAHHMTAPRPDGSQAARSMRLALEDANVSAGEIGYVNTHGSSTPLNDTTETMAIKQVLGDRAYRIPMSGTKGYYGHALGASGAIETAICALAIEREWLPPTVNLQVADRACDLNFLPGTGRKERVEHMLTNSFGFGGINAALVLRRVI